MTWAEFWAPIRLSLQVSLLASAIVLVVGIAVARWMSRASFRGRIAVETVFLLPLVLPPSVVGFLLLVLLGRRSWLGRFVEWLFDAPIIFTWWAAVIASIVVAFPLVYQTMKVGFGAVDQNLEEAARSGGANEWQVFRYIALPLAFRSLVTAFILGFARSLGEFGATLMIAGNIPGRTQTVPTAIYVAVEAGNPAAAWAWTGAIVGVSFILLLLTGRRANSS